MGSSRTTFAYDAANQLSYSQGIGGRTTYVFDANGNQTLERTPAGSRTTTTWDYENQPLVYRLPDTSRVTLAYNADNRRVQKQSAAGTVKFVWDPSADAYQSEADVSNVTQVVYTTPPAQYGQLISQRRGASSHWFHPNSLGSTLALTNSAQITTDTYLYDSWGNPLSSSSSTVNPFRWVGNVGYYFDSETGLYYIRARTYQPIIARWTSVDPLFYMLARASIIGLGSKVPIVNGGYMYLAVSGTDPSGFVSGFFVHPDVLICWSGLRTIANAWRERGHNCAATRLFDFLNGRSSPSCPSSCVSELKKFDGFPPSGCMQHFIAPIGKCGSTVSHHVAFRGSHDFATDNSAWFETTIGTGGSDLYLAFANISWLAEGTCKIACNGCVRSFSCCRCDYDCKLNVFVYDRYDFCSSNPPGLSRYHPLRCACYLENVLGLSYNQMCKYTTVKSGDALFCPALVAKPTPPCKSRSSSGHGPATW